MKEENHNHEIEHLPRDGWGWAVCSCGATIRIEGGHPIGAWHVCTLCISELPK